MKKLFIILLVTLLMCTFICVTVSAETADEGTISSTVLDYFEGVIDKLPSNSDYVAYKVSDYVYYLVTGYNASLSDDGVFTFGECTVHVYNSRAVGSGSNNYTYTPSFSSFVSESMSVNVPDTSIIYSNLGNYSSLGSTSNDTLSYILWAVIFIAFIIIIVKFRRNRRSYVSL